MICAWCSGNYRFAPKATEYCGAAIDVMSQGRRCPGPHPEIERRGVRYLGTLIYGCRAGIRFNAAAHRGRKSCGVWSPVC